MTRKMKMVKRSNKKRIQFIPIFSTVIVATIAFTFFTHTSYGILGNSNTSPSSNDFPPSEIHRDASNAIIVKSTEEEDADSSYNFLDDMIGFMRQNDLRLVRHNVPDERASQRQERACSEDIDPALRILINPSSSISDQTKAANVVSLCTNTNRYYRNYIGAFDESNVLESLVHMVQKATTTPVDVVGSGTKGDGRGSTEDDTVKRDLLDAAAAASEAIYILSYANGPNTIGLSANGAVPALGRLIISSAAVAEVASSLKYGISANEMIMARNHATMWAAAALQNLAASYCDTDSGRCNWKFHFEMNDEDNDYEEMEIEEENDDEEEEENEEEEDKIVSMNNTRSSAKKTKDEYDEKMGKEGKEDEEAKRLKMEITKKRISANENENENKPSNSWDDAADAGSLHLRESNSVIIDASHTREEILSQPGLFDALLHFACLTSNSIITDKNVYTAWPSRAELYDIDEDTQSSSETRRPEIVTWAAIGALKNLVLETAADSGGSQESSSLLNLNKGRMKKCLCAVSFSPDWLESSKAQETLNRLGITDDHCRPPVFNQNGCQDLRKGDISPIESPIAYYNAPEWTNYDHESCTMYAENNWCEKFGYLTSQTSGGISAKEACCSCGGGVDKTSASS